MPSSPVRTASARDRLALQVGTAVLAGVLLAAVLVVPGSRALGPVTPESVALLASVVAACHAAYASVRNRGQMRMCWALLTAMIVANMLGATQWLADGGSQGDRSLSWADALYLVAVPPTAVALLRYPIASGLRRAWRPMLLDALVLGSSVLLVSWVLGLSEVARTLNGTRAFVFLVYPVMDVVILSIVTVVLLRSPGRVRVDVLLLAVTFGAFAVGDQGFALSSVRGVQMADVYLLGYVVAALALAGAGLAAATLDTRVSALLPHLSGSAAPLLPDLAAFVALGTTVAVGVVDRTQTALVVLVLVLAGVRQLSLTVRNQRLRSDLERRVHDRTHELRQLAEEHARLDAMKAELVSAVSHELRTPLTAIRGSLELLVDGDVGELPGPARPVVEMAARGSERLSRLVDDIIDLERLESGSFGFHPAPHDLVPLLADAIDSLGVLASTARVDVRLRAQPDRVVCDGDRITQALVNLVGNALKFTPPGGTVTVSTARAGDELRVSVTDTGRGIPAHELDAIFGRFHQVEPDDARQGAGTGLGLPITRRIIEANGGRLWVESEPGVGSTFHFTLPLEQGPTDDAPVRVPATRAARRTRPRVLHRSPAGPVPG